MVESDRDAVGLEFIGQLLRLTQAMLEAARMEDWEAVAQLTQQRTDLIATDAGKLPPVPGSEPTWREVERLNREVLSLTETQLQQLGDSVQTARNQQRLKQSYGGG